MFSGVVMAFFSHTGNICWIFLHAGIAECKPYYTPVDTNPKWLMLMVRLFLMPLSSAVFADAN